MMQSAMYRNSAATQARQAISNGLNSELQTGCSDFRRWTKFANLSSRRSDLARF
jgi:hypothetical protein